MAWTETDIPDLTGRTAVVTGANGGLGLETAIALANAGATVVMAARNQEKATGAEARIRAQNGDVDLEIVPLDLGDLGSVRSAATQILAAHPTIDLLINNAGLMAMPEGRTADGFETQFGVDHLGHYAFTTYLLPALLAADAARVVTVTSTARHFGSTVDPTNPNLEGKYGAWKSYGQAKKANYHFALGLDQRFRAAGVAARSLTAHPGLSNTDLQRHTVEEGGGGVLGSLSEKVGQLIGMSAMEGARPQLRAATDPGASGGELYAPMFVGNGPPVRMPVIRHPLLQRQIDTVFEVSEQETGIHLDIAAAGSARPEESA